MTKQTDKTGPQAAPSTVVPQQQRSMRSRQKILQAAEEVFAASGPDGARIDKIAQLSQINKQRIYAYFGSKKELYHEVLVRNYTRAAQDDELAGLSEDDVPDLTATLVKAFFGYHKKHPLFWRLLSWENLTGGRTLSDGDWADIRAGHVEQIRRLYAAGQERGCFRRDVAFSTYMIMVFAFTYFYYSNQMTISRLLQVELASDDVHERIASEIETVITAGLGKRN